MSFNLSSGICVTSLSMAWAHFCIKLTGMLQPRSMGPCFELVSNSLVQMLYERIIAEQPSGHRLRLPRIRRSSACTNKYMHANGWSFAALSAVHRSKISRTLSSRGKFERKEDAYKSEWTSNFSKMLLHRVGSMIPSKIWDAILTIVPWWSAISKNCFDGFLLCSPSSSTAAGNQCANWSLYCFDRTRMFSHFWKKLFKQDPEHLNDSSKSQCCSAENSRSGHCPMNRLTSWTCIESKNDRPCIRWTNNPAGIEIPLFIWFLIGELMNQPRSSNPDLIAASLSLRDDEFPIRRYAGSNWIMWTATDVSKHRSISLDAESFLKADTSSKHDRRIPRSQGFRSVETAWFVALQLSFWNLDIFFSCIWETNIAFC